MTNYYRLPFDSTFLEDGGPLHRPDTFKEIYLYVLSLGRNYLLLVYRVHEH